MRNPSLEGLVAARPEAHKGFGQENGLLDEELICQIRGGKCQIASGENAEVYVALLRETELVKNYKIYFYLCDVG